MEDMIWVIMADMGMDQVDMVWAMHQLVTLILRMVMDMVMDGDGDGEKTSKLEEDIRSGFLNDAFLLFLNLHI